MCSGDFNMEMKRIGPVENVVGEELIRYTYTPVDTVKKTNDNLVLYFKSGEVLFISSVRAMNPDRSVLFLSPVDENVH